MALRESLETKVEGVKWLTMGNIHFYKVNTIPCILEFQISVGIVEEIVRKTSGFAQNDYLIKLWNLTKIQTFCRRDSLAFSNSMRFCVDLPTMLRAVRPWVQYQNFSRNTSLALRELLESSVGLLKCLSPQDIHFTAMLELWSLTWQWYWGKDCNQLWWDLTCLPHPDMHLAAVSAFQPTWVTGFDHVFTSKSRFTQNADLIEITTLPHVDSLEYKRQWHWDNLWKQSGRE